MVTTFLGFVYLSSVFFFKASARKSWAVVLMNTFFSLIFLTVMFFTTTLQAEVKFIQYVENWPVEAVFHQHEEGRFFISKLLTTNVCRWWSDLFHIWQMYRDFCISWVFERLGMRKIFLIFFGYLCLCKSSTVWIKEQFFFELKMIRRWCDASKWNHI